MYACVICCLPLFKHVKAFWGGGEGWLLFMCGAEDCSKQFSLCFAEFMAAVNFNDTSIMIGGEVNQLTESQGEKNKEIRLNNVNSWELTVIAERDSMYPCRHVIQDMAVIYFQDRT